MGQMNLTADDFQIFEQRLLDIMVGVISFLIQTLTISAPIENPPENALLVG